MKWKINYSARALEDLKAIYEYIAFKLLVSETAMNQINRIMDRISKLDEMPLIYKSYEEEPWRSRGLRVFSAGKYVVLYLPKEDQKTVNIVRIIYGGRDIKKQLDETNDI